MFFSNDYPTIVEGGVRNKIHVIDLIATYVAAIDNFTEGAHVYNLETGKGTSVLKLVKAFEEADLDSFGCLSPPIFVEIRSRIKGHVLDMAFLLSFLY